MENAGTLDQAGSAGRPAGRQRPLRSFFARAAVLAAVWGAIVAGASEIIHPTAAATPAATQPGEALAAASAPADKLAGTILREGLAIRVSEDLRARTGMSLDPVEADLVLGRRAPPKAGMAVAFGDGAVRSWQPARADEKGWFELEALEGGYVYFRLDSPRKRTMLLEGMGHDMVYVNGEPRAGNQYGTTDEYQAWEPRFTFSVIPIELRAGRNDLLFKCYRGRLKVRLRETRPGALLNAADLTLPDLIAGEPSAYWGAVVVVNASPVPLRDAVLRVGGAPAGGAGSGMSKANQASTGSSKGEADRIETKRAMAGAGHVQARSPGVGTAGPISEADPVGKGRLRPTETAIPVIPPFSIRKVGFRIEGAAPADPGDDSLALELVRGADQRSAAGRGPGSAARRGEDRNDVGRSEPAAAAAPDGSGSHAGLLPMPALDRAVVLDRASIPIRVVNRGEVYKRTFLSGIDGSVQYYAVNPARGAEPGGRPLALFFSLHGAAVEALNQARAYAPKTWGHIVAPTNRRPFGYNWEDWGQLDALEVLALVEKELNIDPERVYLTGHSMGGHGTWHIGETFPDRFAAIGPSAGWLSFYSYRSRKGPDASTPIGAILARATSPSDTFALAPNLKQEGVYVLHGSDDDNVPVTESRRMVEVLSGFHRDFVYHEQKGAGHWWDLSDEPGADCVDWPPLFDFFARRARPGAGRVRQVDFITASPGISSRSDWLEIEAQTKPLGLSSASVRYEPGSRRFTGSTDNVARLSFELAPLAPEGPVSVELDGQKLDGISISSLSTRGNESSTPSPSSDSIATSRMAGAAGGVWNTGRERGPKLRLERRDGAWAVADEPSPSLKGPHRYGTLKDAFRNRVLFVYGTKGTPEENAWAFAKARYDAERFWYQGNGSIELVPDTGFDAAADPDRNVVLYGNARTNAAWGPLLGASPVQVDGEAVRIGDRRVAGADLACLFIRPRPGSPTASVGAIAGTGIAGMRLTDNKLYLEAGYPFPDFLLFRAAGPASGDGLLAAGFFDLDWSVGRDFAWSE